MALKVCPDCGKQLSTSAALCPHCGRPSNPRAVGIGATITKVARLFLIFFVVLPVGYCTYVAVRGTQGAVPGSSATNAAVPESSPAAPPMTSVASSNRSAADLMGDLEHALSLGQIAKARQAKDELRRMYPEAQETRRAVGLISEADRKIEEGRSSWEYESKSDAMGRGTIKFASVQSSNAVTFEFPYNKLQAATLTLRRHPQYGNDVYVTLEKAQFLCHHDDCSVLIRFDNGAAQRFGAAEPEDNSTNMLFILGFDRFLAAARKAKIIRIEAKFYQEGTRVFEFPAQNLKW